MATIGKVNKIPISGYDIEWQIPKFSSLTEEDDHACYSSPLFSFAGASWCLKMYPNGNGMGDSCIVFLKRKSSGPPTNLQFSLGLKTLDGSKDPIEHYTYIFNEEDEGFGFTRCLSIDELLERKFEFMPKDVLTVFCNLKYTKSTDDGNGLLSQDYKKVLFNGLHHDLTLKMGDKELRAHQDILRARSRVFESMLSYDMIEKNSGIINVPDCDPEAMEQFLLHVYCGKVETLNQSNMLSLYYIADKYDMEDLKEKCCEFIKKSLSLTNICRVVQLALNHSDTSLLEDATYYFGKNVKDILRSVEWQSFLKDNSAIANELLIKYFDKTNI